MEKNTPNHKKSGKVIAGLVLGIAFLFHLVCSSIGGIDVI